MEAMGVVDRIRGPDILFRACRHAGYLPRIAGNRARSETCPTWRAVCTTLFV